MMDKRVSAESAVYMELSGARKDGDCEVVAVDGGISRDLGCCNLFQPESKDTQAFSCGTCEYVTGQAGQGNDSTRPLTKDSSKGMSFKEILDSELPVEGKQ
jgi:hypothetical protein